MESKLHRIVKIEKLHIIVEIDVLVHHVQKAGNLSIHRHCAAMFKLMQLK